MKTILSLVLTAILLITLSIALCYGPLISVESTQKDLRQFLSQKIKEQGAYFQALADEDPVMAKQKFESMMKTNLSDILKSLKLQIAALTEEEAHAQMDIIRQTPLVNQEKRVTILTDHSTTEKQKLELLLSESSSESLFQYMDTVKKKIESRGYEKVFTDFSGEILNRSYDSSYKDPRGPEIYDTGLLIVLCLGILGAWFYLLLYFAPGLSTGAAVAIVFLTFLWGLAGGGG